MSVGLVLAQANARIALAAATGSCLHAECSRLGSAFRRLMRQGTLVRPLRGLYAARDAWVALTPTERHLSLVQALARLHPEWVFCGPTACLLHGLDCSYADLSKIHVLAEASMSHTTQGIQRHKVAYRQVCRRKGVWCVGLEDALAHSLRRVSFGAALGLADSALRQTGRSRRWLQGLFAEAHKGLRGVGQARVVAALADGRSENGGESAVRARIFELGFQVPRLQVRFNDPRSGARYRVDYCWRKHVGSHRGRGAATAARRSRGLVVGELDGAAKYVDPRMTHGRSRAEVLEGQDLREARLRRMGATVVRFSFAEAMDGPHLWKALRRAGVPLCSEREGEIARLAQPTAPARRPGSPRRRIAHGCWGQSPGHLRWETWGF